ncbi:hypothetical protein AKO1_008613 [Acrasis kona]|uniref:Gustatory receptor n=1 Tax=Acrasis kona TaxID=1008807 RepID=A0AAW2YNK2_9EUKA
MRPFREIYHSSIRLLRIYEPKDRRFMQMRGAWRTIQTHRLVVPHHNRIIDTRLTLEDAYGIRRGKTTISLLRFFNILMVDLMIWFSWMNLMLVLFGIQPGGVPYFWNIAYIFRDCSTASSFTAYVICTFLNSWTSIRRIYLRNADDGRRLAAIRENQINRANYVAMSSYLIMSIFISLLYAVWDGNDGLQYLYLIPFSRYLSFDTVKWNAVQIIRYIVFSGIINVFIGSIAMSLGNEQRLPDPELCFKKHVDWKEWLNFPFGTLGGIIRTIENKSKK